MKIFDVLEQLENLYNKYGNIDVVVKDRDEDEPDIFEGYLSDTGNVYSKYELDTFTEDFKEEAKMFSPEELMVFV